MMADTMQSSPAPYHSSSSISSPPVSPGHNDSDTLHLAPPKTSAVQHAAAATGTPAPISKTTTTQPGTTADKPKRPRKKKELGPDGKPIDDGKPKRQRKPAAPKPANGTAPANPRKKLKTEHDNTKQTTLTNSINNVITPSAAVSIPKNPEQPVTVPTTSAARPANSGQRYDPVRGVAVDYVRPSQPSTPSVTTVTPAAQPINRASASPSIASLIDNPVMSASINSPQPVIAQSFQPTPHRVPNGIAALPTQASPSPVPKIVNNDGDAMDIDQKPAPKNGVTDKSSDAKAPSKASSAAQTPKAAPPKATGSGLLSSSDLFGGPSNSEGLLSKGVNIDIKIKLDPAGGNHINVAQEIIKKYGQDALYPRAAAHRERLLRVMAEANKLEGSADEGGEDVMSEGEGDSNVEMGGMNDTADGEKPRAKRQKKDDYDLDDEFIDDTELAWQQQAAVAKDGFFVYSGPLRTEADVAKAEANAGKGGRGRGGRRGKATTTHASFAEKKEVTSTPSTSASAPARGRGSRGGRTTGAPRKSRVTKAEKEKLEAEKAEGEKQAATTTSNGAAAVANGVPPASAVASSPAPVSSVAHVLGMTGTPAAVVGTTAT